MLPEKIIYIGVLVNLICTFLYIRGIFNGITKPNLVSWLIWALAPLVGFFLQIKANAGLSSIGVLLAGLGPLLVVIFSLFKRNAFWKISFLDIFCGILSLLAIGVYILTKNLVISISFAILADLVAYIPTFIKTYKHPETEIASTYFGGIINNVIALFIIKNWNYAIFSFPLYLVFINIIEVYFIYRKKMLYSIYEK